MTLIDDPARDPAASPADPFAVNGTASYALSLLMVALAAVLAVLVDARAPAPNLSLIFVLPVVIAAVTWGWGPAMAAAAGGALAYNFFLIAPRYTLRVSDPANVWALVLLIAVAAIVSAVAAQARARAIVAGRQAQQYAALQNLARSLVAAGDRASILRAAREALAGVFQAPVRVLFDTGSRFVEAGDSALAEADLEAARWALASRLASRAGAYPAQDAEFDFWPVITPSRLQAVIGVDWSGRPRPAEPDRLIEIISGYLAVALERDALAQAMVATRLAEQGERVKADLLAAVSHDLRTPLSTILVSLQSLRTFAGVHDAAAQDRLLSTAETETERLAGLVGNLLDMNRVESGALRAEPVPVAPADLTARVLARLVRTLQGHPVSNLVAADAPFVLADPALAEAALANVLENAAKYAPPGTPIELRTEACEGGLAFDVIDHGPGFGGPAEPLFEKFARGVAGDGRPPGTGLGLAIARSYLQAQGGRIEAADQPAGGARVRLVLPLARTESAAAT